METLVAGLGEFLTANKPLTFVVAFLGGSISGFSPCSLASVPLVIAYVGGYARDNQRRAFIYSLFFCIGLVITFTALGALAATLGRLMSIVGKTWNLILGSFTILLGLWLMEVIDIRLPAFSPEKFSRLTGVLGAFLLGILGGVISSPCSTPALAAILALVAGRGNPALGVLLLGVYAVGHSIPLLIVGTSIAFVNRLVSRRAEGIGRAVKLILGAVVVLIGIYLFYIGI